MMTNSQFDDLWNGTFGPLLPATPLPNYNDYLLRERMLEDYLDIFRGYSTREIEGAIVLPYSHPFFNADGTPKLAKMPCIKYILVGEAPPPLKTSVLNGCNGDKKNSYIYDITHVKSSPWLTSPRDAFGVCKYSPCSHDKIAYLLELASEGVLLLDIYPFAILFAGLRKRLNKKGITLSFWNDPINLYNLQERINRIGTLLCKDWDLSFVAPYLTSEYIVNPAYGFPPLAIVPSGLHLGTFRALLPDPTRFAGNHFQKIAIRNSAYPCPSAHLVSISF
jgi:hypothetical protein